MRHASVLSLAALLLGCASSTNTGREQTRASGDFSRDQVAKKSRRAAKIESDGAYGFTLSEIVRIDSDVRQRC